jgi:hypothetical protein
MPALPSLISPIASIIDKIVPDPVQRDAAKLQLLQLQGTQDMQLLQAQVSAVVADTGSTGPWTNRARPTFLYVMYIIILWSVPMGIIGAFDPDRAKAIASAMTAYLRGLPEPLYALFGTGYLGYTAARQWGKIAGSDK